MCDEKTYLGLVLPPFGAAEPVTEEMTPLFGDADPAMLDVRPWLGAADP